MQPVPVSPPPVVLLVEDEKSLLEITAYHLRDLGCEVLCADGPEPALEIYAQQGPRIDFVFTDLRMAGIGGRGLIDRLMTQDPEVRVVATSALIDELDAVRERWGERVRLMLKPYDAEELEVLLRVEHRGDNADGGGAAGVNRPGP